jgi:putative intracellular protease/amidase
MKNFVRAFTAAAALGAAILASPAHAQSTNAKPKVLVILSSESVLPLKDGKTYTTGYYLNELMIPAKRFTDAGFELVFADPKGNRPAVDAMSISKDYFGGSQQALEDAQRFQASLTALAHPLRISQVAAGDLSQYKAIFVPGGPAPLIDLMADRDLGTILRSFHANRKTTILLCHGPIALLSAMDDPVANQAALRSGDAAKAIRLASSWTYKDYRMTIFSDEEEAVAAKYAFHAEPLFYPQQALTAAGGRVTTVAAWQPNVVKDRELITGQNPGSDSALMDVVLSTLASH